ncbi:MAG: hypothetical protein NC344_10150 [Bacteroidales bacterium]|nr:hypothetical protein [Bacteroidales bacterium]
MKVNRSVFASARRSGVNISDETNIEIYERFTDMMSAGQKKAFVVACIAAEFNISERTLFRIIKRMSKNVVL